MNRPRRPAARAAARAAVLSFALAAVTLHGRIVDTTTGQPLVRVAVDVFAGRDAAGRRLGHAVTDADGRFVLRRLHRGWYALALSSDDVPRAVEAVRVDSARPPELRLEACSTTLDYSCAPEFDVPRDGSNSNG